MGPNVSAENPQTGGDSAALLFDSKLGFGTSCLIHRDDSELNLKNQEPKVKPKEKKPIATSNEVETAFTWHNGGNEVFLIGSFCNWAQRISMQRNGNEFTAVLKLPRGLHLYKFIVDNDWRYCPHKPTKTDSHGNINNFMDTTDLEVEPEEKEVEHHILPTQGYSAMIPSSTDFADECPMYPSQLCKSVLDPVNKTQKKERLIKKSSNRQYIQDSFFSESTFNTLNIINDLDYPKHVQLNHVLSHSFTNNVNAVAITRRVNHYKYVTMMYYYKKNQRDSESSRTSD